MFLDHRINIGFLKDHVTLKTGVMIAENSDLPPEIKFILKYIKTECNLKKNDNISELLELYFSIK